MAFESFSKCAAVVALGAFVAFAAGEAAAETYYVKPDGDDTAAGTSAATALKSLSVALAKADVTEIQVMEGRHTAMTPTPAPNTKFKVGFQAVVTQPVRIVGAGADCTTIVCNKGSNTYAGGIWVDHAEAEVSGLSIEGVSCGADYSSFGAALHVVAGYVHDCAFRNCDSSERSAMAYLGGANALVRDCAVTNNVFNQFSKCMPGVVMSAGRLERCLVSGCRGGQGAANNGCGLTMSGGTAADCVISNNSAYSSYNTVAGGVYMSAGSLLNCTVAANNNSSWYQNNGGIGVGGVYVAGDSCIVSNCTIKGNVNYSHYGINVAGLLLNNKSAKVYETTIEDNLGLGGPELYMSGACLVTNCTIRNREGNETVRQLGGTLVDCTVDDGTAGDTRPAVTYVAQGKGNEPPYDTADKATPSLQKAIDAVKIGGTVVVASGDYTENLDLRTTVVEFRRNVVIAKPVTVKGPDDASAVFTYRNATDHSCGIQIGCTNAFVSGLTLKGSFALNGDTRFNYCGSVLHLNAGTVSNCVVTGCYSDKHSCQPAAVSGGLMTHTTVRDNAYSYFGRGCQGLWVSGGSFAHGAVLRNGIPNTNSDKSQANGVIMTGGSISDTIIEGNYGGAKNTDTVGSGVKMSGGTLERCIVQCNTNSTPDKATQAGGVLASGGTIRNCLIAANRAATSKSSSAGGLYATVSGVTVQHVTLLDNDSTAGVKDAYLANGASMVGSISETAVAVGTGTPDVYTTELNFRDPSVAFPVTWANTDAYSITAASAGYNAVQQNYVTNDLLGAERPTVEPGGTDFPDAGAMEKVKATGIVALVDPAVATLPKGGTQRFTVSIDGDDTRVASCEWTVTLGSESKTETVTSDTYDFTASAAGVYTLSVKVTNQSGDVSPAKDIQVTSKPRTCYVAMDGASISPYDDPTKAATNIADAIRAVYGVAGDPGVVHVAAGGYTNQPPMTAASGKTYFAVLDRPVHLVADEGPADTFIVFASTDDVGGGVLLGDGEAMLAGFTVSGEVGVWPGTEEWQMSGTGVTMSKGVVSNCVVSACIARGNWMPAMLMSGGTLVSSTVGPNLMTMVGSGAIGLVATGGTVTNCTIAGNVIDPKATSIYQLRAGGVYVSGTGRVVDTLVCSNQMVSSGSFSYGGTATAAGAVVAGGTFEHCRVFDNDYSMVANDYDAAGITVSGSGTVVRHCLVTGNRSVNTASQSGAGMTVGAGTVTNCTITGNGQYGGVGMIGGLGVRGGTVKNMIVWDNEAGDVSVADDCVTYSCAGEQISGEGNISKNPKLRARDKAIGRSSPCAKSGESRMYMGYLPPYFDGFMLIVR